MKKQAKEITEQNATLNDIAGLGPNPIKLVDAGSKQVIAYVGKEQVYFAKTVSIDELDAVFQFLQKRKFNKHLSKENFDQAQNFADRKFPSIIKNGILR